MTKEDAFVQALAGAIAPMMGFTELDEATVLNHVETGLHTVIHALEQVVALCTSGAMAKENQILYSVELV